MLESSSANGSTCNGPKTNMMLVVLNWNNGADTLHCLRSLEHAGVLHAVVVVDNGSTDSSVVEIEAHYPCVPIIATGANLGYAGGNNVGIRYALDRGVDFIGVLNNDVVVEPDFVEPLIGIFQQQPEIGIVTPLVAERVDDGQVWAMGSAVNWRTAAVTRQHAGEPINAWRGRLPFPVEIASGAAMLVRREVFNRVGLLDESFFLYYEETDWCLRAGRAGCRILAVPSSIVWHKVSAALGASSPAIDYYMLRNHLRLISRHWSDAHRVHLWSRVVLHNLLVVAAFTAKPHGGQRIPNRNARLLALRDAILGRWGKMGPDVARICYPSR